MTGRRIVRFAVAALLAILPLGLARAADSITITGDKFVVDEANRHATFDGNVVVKTPTIQLWANEVVITYGEKGTTDVQTFEATGTVRIKTSEQDATGQKAVYDPKTQILHLIGNVTVTSPTSTLSGPELVVNLKTNTSTFTGSKGGRVTGVFSSQ